MIGVVASLREFKSREQVVPKKTRICGSDGKGKG